MTIRAIVIPDEGETFEPFEIVIERPHAGDAIVRRKEYVQAGQPSTFKVRQVAVLENRFVSADRFSPRRRIDLLLRASPTVPFDLPL